VGLIAQNERAVGFERGDGQSSRGPRRMVSPTARC
jgi:hypothetical protein